MKRLFTVMLYVFIIGIICSFLFIKYFSDKIAPVLINNGEAEARRIITLIINNSVSKELLENVDMDYMFDIVRDSDGEIEMIDFNTVNVTRVLDMVTDLIQDNLSAVTEGNVRDIDVDFGGITDIDYERISDGVIYYIPMGSAGGSGLLNNIGPKIPIKLVMIGDVVAVISSDIKEYGINNAMIVVKIDIDVSVLVNMAFVSRRVNIETSVPIIMKVIQGSVPEYYLGNSSYN